MQLHKYLKLFDSNYVKEKIFRREIENSFSTRKNYALPKVKYATKESLDNFKMNFPFSFYAGNSAADYSTWLERIENNANTISSADELIDNIFTFFNGEKFSLDEKINWNTDNRSKFTWAEDLSWKIDYLNFPQGVDPEYAWHLGRFEFGFILAKAYLLTSNEKYLQKYVDFLSEFSSMATYCTGIQWVKSSEVSIRLINCLLSFGMVIHSPSINDTVINSFLRLILLHAVYIENNLETKIYRGYEYLLNLLSLGMVGVLFADTQYGKRNLKFAFAELEQEIRSQVHKDGVSIHQSVSYHELIIKIFCLAEKYLQQPGKKFSEVYKTILKKLFLVQKEYLRKNGTVPAIGDDLNFTLAPFNHSKRNSDVLAIGVVLFNNIGLKIVDQSLTAEVLFLYGIKSAEEYSSMAASETEIKSIGFLSGGHFISRKEHVEIFIEAGEIGNKGRGAPGHNDTFTFELYYKNKPIIVDPGTYSFYADPILRNQLRSVKRHNTFYIDNKLLAEFEGSFKIKEDFTKPKILDWQTSETEDLLSVQHHAYARLFDPVIIKRTFHFQKDKNVLRIKDEFYGGAEHQISGNLTFHPDVLVTQTNANDFTAVNNDAEVQISIKSSADKTSVKILPAEYSKCYGALAQTKRIFINTVDRLPCFIITEINLL
ncbi:MAG: alginate lyase family protein [Ignavibacteriales bacterium]|nr:alginate lyase family protein [Ignavibacteriales bacterium]